MNEHSPKVDEDTMPGELANVVSGRVANLLDLQGPNHAMDAASFFNGGSHGCL